MNAKAYCITDKKYCKAYIDALFPAGKWLAGITITLSIVNFAAIIAFSFSAWEKAKDLALVLIFLLINNILLSLIFSLLYLPFYSSVKKSETTRIEYIFGDREFDIISYTDGETNKHNEPVKYSSLKKIKRRKNKIIIFEDKFSAHIIDEKNLEGNPKEIYLIIKDEIDDKKSGS